MRLWAAQNDINEVNILQRLSSTACASNRRACINNITLILFSPTLELYILNWASDEGLIKAEPRNSILGLNL
jgi:hypothetical protein